MQAQNNLQLWSDIKSRLHVACLVIFQRSIEAMIAVFTSEEWFDSDWPWFLLFSPRGNSRGAIKMSSIDCWIRGLVTGERERESEEERGGKKQAFDSER